jgi:hypothetical protein
MVSAIGTYLAQLDCLMTLDCWCVLCRYGRAADLGDPKAKFALGSRHCSGRGVEEDWDIGYEFGSKVFLFWKVCGLGWGGGWGWVVVGLWLGCGWVGLWLGCGGSFLFVAVVVVVVF